LNFSGFVYPSYPYYPVYPYYGAYPAYSMPYGPGYSTGEDAALYSEPVAVSPRRPADNVLVFTAPPEPPPVPSPQASVSIPERSPPPLPVGDGSLHFEVSPGDARIFLDDRYLGEAHELRNIAEITATAGRHLLEIRVGRDRTFTEVVVAPHQVTPVQWTLDVSAAPAVSRTPETGRLRIRVSPPGAAIYLNGVFATVAQSGHSTSLDLSPGRHHVEVVMPGYRRYAAHVTVPGAGEAIVAAQLARE
jgi:hypothetical protein